MLNKQIANDEMFESHSNWLLMNGFVNTVSDYTILEINGRGTYGEVFRAIHKRTGDIVALKKVCVFMNNMNLRLHIQMWVFPNRLHEKFGYSQL